MQFLRLDFLGFPIQLVFFVGLTLEVLGYLLPRIPNGCTTRDALENLPVVLTRRVVDESRTNFVEGDVPLRRGLERQVLLVAPCAVRDREAGLRIGLWSIVRYGGTNFGDRGLLLTFVRIG